MVVVYLRVSTSVQNLARQKEAICQWQKEKMITDENLRNFEEKASAKNTNNRI
ncbi:hypothetical protein A5868_001388 [Enterococcus sp. 12F9_DIV0723]|uniref:recombinase family protein n=1 Tax=Enterococcus sp. 12F9_DIV0723 TaxID=1834169 RepID=UPI000B3ECB0C|nr:recombinase family protein [Enterococcus sp. 12F9_DIV0723]OUZ16467.1 hypothetical protein A5868_001388 [Enterococcus sp. 12F9_DIV0723]